MRSTLQSLFLAAAFLLTGGALHAQLTGTVTVPGTYADLNAAITALNTQGVGAGGVIINISAPQQAPVGGYLLGSTALNASVSSTKTITINGNSNTVNAPVGTSTTADGIFIIKGTDYLTIDGLNLTDTNNVSATTQMEWGYALVKLNVAAPFDGCQNVTIKNCAINLKASNANSTGIYANHVSAAGVALSTTGVTAGDANSNNTFTGNTIINISRGIYLNGISSASFYDYNNKIGGATASTANNITMGGAANTCYGIYAYYDSVLTVQNNLFAISQAQNSTVYDVYLGTGKGDLNISQNSFNFTSTVSSSSIYGVYNGGYTDATKTYTFSGNTMTGNNTITTGYLYAFYNGGYTFGTVNITNNSISNITWGSSASTAYLYLFYNSAAATPTVNCTGNTIYNITRNGTTGYIYGYYNYTTSATTGLVTITNNVFKKVSNYYYIYGFYNYSNSAGAQSLVNKYNKIDSVTITSSGYLYGNYTNYYCGASTDISYDTVSNVSVNSGGVYGLYSYYNVNADLHHNVLTNISTTSTGYLYTLYVYSNTTGQVNIYNNNINNLSMPASTSSSVYGAYLWGTAPVNFYNNFISQITAPVLSSSGIYGVYLGSAITYRLYNNTIYLNPASTGASFGVTGVYYSSGVTSLDLRNNIINVNALPGSSGTVVALRRSSGTAGVPPANLAITSTGNIYYVPNAANCYLYGESTSTSMVNGYSLSNDPGFNTPCGLYKTFMTPRENASFTENNLVAGALPNTFAPTGSSYAKSNGVITTLPAVTLDYAGNTRPSPPDVGALQFTATALDAAAPAISYTPWIPATYCSGVAPLVATITDATGVNTATGTAPRLYFKKSSENNSFGGANSSSYNGWKWVESTNVGSQFTFIINYSLLTSAVTSGDSIQYFIIAQDVNATPNAGASIAAFPSGYCPSGVNLGSSAGPIAATPATNGYRILSVPTFNATATQPQLCLSGVTTLGINPVPAGATVQWQQDMGTSNWSNITGATSVNYTTPTLFNTTRYRAIIQCGGNTIATSTTDTIVVNLPQILTTTPGSTCGPGTVVLGATGVTGNSINWYTAATGGTAVGTGNSFTTPSISATTTYYAAASSGGGTANLGLATPISTTGNTGYSDVGLAFDAYSAFTLQSVVIYPLGTGTGSITIALKNSLGTILQTATASFTCGQANTISLNFPVTAGTAYRLVATAASGLTSLTREVTTGFTYPYTLPGVASITSAYTGGVSSSYYYYFYNWTVTTGCETPRTAVVATVYTPPVSTITASGPTAICPGSSVTLSTPVGTGYTYQWQYNGNNIPGATSAAYSATAAGNYNVKVTNPANNGCSSTTPVSTVVSFLSPPATAIAAGLTTFCSGGVILNANTGTGLSYQWQQNGTAITGATNASYNATASGNYTVTVTTAATGCVSTSAPIAVSANTAPAFVSPAGPATFCQGSSLTLSAPVVPGLTYQWNNNGTAIAGATNATYNATVAGNYTVTVSGGSGCTGTSPVAAVSTNPAPPTTLSQSGTINICAGTTLTLTGPTGNNLTYQWLSGTANIPGATSNTYTTGAVGTYSLVVTNTATGCTATSASASLVQIPIPQVSTVPSSAATGCDSVIITANSGAGLTYQWKQNGVTIPGANSASFAAKTSGTYSVTVVNSTGCSATSVPVPVAVNLSPASVVTYTSPLVFCQGGAVVLNTYSIAGQTYQWMQNSQAIAGATTPLNIVSQSGVYAVTITGANGCSRVSQPVLVQVNPLPTPVVTMSNGVLRTGSYLTYKWFLNNQAMPGAYGSFIVPSGPGAYSVAVTDSNGCSNVSPIFFANSVGIGHVSVSGEVKVYPNPTTGLIHVDAPVKVKLAVRNITGKTVLTANGVSEINISGLADGMYLLYITNTEGQLIRTEKITKTAY